MPAAKKQSIWRPAKFALSWKKPTTRKPAMTQDQAMGRQHKDTETQRGPVQSGDRHRNSSFNFVVCPRIIFDRSGPLCLCVFVFFSILVLQSRAFSSDVRPRIRAVTAFIEIDPSNYAARI